MANVIETKHGYPYFTDYSAIEWDEVEGYYRSAPYEHYWVVQYSKDKKFVRFGLYHPSEMHLPHKPWMGACRTTVYGVPIDNGWTSRAEVFNEVFGENYTECLIKYSEHTDLIGYVRKDCL